MAAGMASNRVSKDSVDQIYWAVTHCVYSGKEGSVDDNAAQAPMAAAQKLEPVAETAETLQLDCPSVTQWDPCHNFCCRGPILIPRPDSETSALTTRVNVLEFL